MCPWGQLGDPNLPLGAMRRPKPAPVWGEDPPADVQSFGIAAAVCADAWGGTSSRGATRKDSLWGGVGVGVWGGGVTPTRDGATLWGQGGVFVPPGGLRRGEGGTQRGLSHS